MERSRGLEGRTLQVERYSRCQICLPGYQLNARLIPPMDIETFGLTQSVFLLLYCSNAHIYFSKSTHAPRHTHTHTHTSTHAHTFVPVSLCLCLSVSLSLGLSVSLSVCASLNLSSSRTIPTPSITAWAEVELAGTHF